MKKILITVQTGYEETELITTIDVLKRNEIEYYLWSVEGLASVKSSHEAIVETHPEFPTSVNFDGIFFPGGAAVDALLDYDEVLHLAKSYTEEGKIVSAICAAPRILKKAGVLEGKRYTASEVTTELTDKTNNAVEIDGKLITGRDYTVTYEFAQALSKEIKNS